MSVRPVVSVRRFASSVAAALLLALVAVPLRAAPMLSVSAVARGGTLVASLTFRWDPPDELLASLQGGLESRIVFTARLYEKRAGLLAFRADRLVSQATVVRTAYRDILTQMFVVDEEGAAPRSYATTRELIAALFSVPGLTFTDPAAARRGSYVAARAQLEPVRLMPPLTLVTLAGVAAYATPWARSDQP